MTTRKKKPFWTKLLSALLVASMLVGTAGTSSFAAGDPQQKTEAGATVSDDSAGDNEDTAEKAAADTVEEDASASDGAADGRDGRGGVRDHVELVSGHTCGSVLCGHACGCLPLFQPLF